MTDPGGRRDGAAVCPFVAFAEDRDRRASEPDSHHRCYADEPPAPRAIGHQETFCLTGNFAGCPTFVDWAKGQAAQAIPMDATAAAAATAAGGGGGEEEGRAGEEAHRLGPERGAPAELADRDRLRTDDDADERD